MVTRFTASRRWHFGMSGAHGVFIFHTCRHQPRVYEEQHTHENEKCDRCRRMIIRHIPFGISDTHTFGARPGQILANSGSIGQPSPPDLKKSKMCAPLGSHSLEDAQFLDDVLSWHIIGFRNASFPAAFIEKNPGFFLDNSWISVSKLKVFINDQAPSFIPVHIPNASGVSCPNPPSATSTKLHVKSEQHEPSFSSPKIKIEPGLPSVKPSTGVIVKTRISHEQGQDVIEIMDTDSDNDSIPIKREQTLQIMADFKMAIGDTNIPLDVELLMLAMSQDKVLDAKAFTQASSTQWDDEGLSSRGKRMTPDALIKDKDQDA
ncbi:hypothetical protein C8J56DRAFT_890529 [Mycena floridula]|nr:hypothetical protein C8J56DRAFT_890529 [Mycena floridula]